jgi:plasmid stabilization system protein ParE
MPGTRRKPLDWAPHAGAAYHQTLAIIAAEDPAAANAVRERVNRALESIAAFPRIGTPGHRRSERIFAIPNTGHVLHYRVLARSIRVTLWYRARQKIRG